MRPRALRRYQKGDIAVYRYGDGTPTKEQVLTGHTDIVLRVLFWPSRPNTMISCSRDGSVIMWDTQLGKATRTYKYAFVS
jgi:WD40 repeat protein